MFSARCFNQQIYLKIIIKDRQKFWDKITRTREKREIYMFVVHATKTNPKETARNIHRRKFSLAEVDANRLKHNNEIVIPREPSFSG